MSQTPQATLKGIRVHRILSGPTHDAGCESKTVYWLDRKEWQMNLLLMAQHAGQSNTQ